MSLKKAVILFFLFCCCFVHANKFDFDQLTVEDGLSSSSLRAVCQDTLGYVWVGSVKGLDRYDGWSIESYNDLFVDNIKHVTAIVHGPENLWVGTHLGLRYWDKVSDSFSCVGSSELDSVYIKSMKIHWPNTLFLSTNLGMYSVQLDTHKVTKIDFHKAAESSFHELIDFCIYDDNLLIASSEVFATYDTKKQSSIIYPLHEFLESYRLSLSSIQQIAVYNDVLYVATQKKGVFALSMKDKKSYFVGDIHNAMVLSMEVIDKQLFIGTDADGLFVFPLELGYDAGLSSHYLTSSSIYSICTGRSHQLWLGTYSQGLYSAAMYDLPFATEQLTFSQEINDVNARCLLFCDGMRVMGTRDGLYVAHADGRVDCFTKANSVLSAKVVLSLYDMGEYVLVGTYGGGVYQYSKKEHTLELWSDDELLANQSVYGFVEDASERLWVSTFDGLAYVEDGHVHTFNYKNCDLKEDRLFALQVDHEQRIWVGTMRGVYVFQYINQALHLVSHFPDFPKTKVTSFYLDDDNSVWITTDNMGCYQFSEDLDLLNHYTKDAGMCDNCVSAIIKINTSKYLISTLKGASVLDTETGDFTNFNLSDGMPSLSFNSGAILKGDRGLVWLGNNDGLVSFDAHLATNDFKSDIVITDVFLEGVSQDASVFSDCTEIESVEQFTLKGKHDVGFRFVCTSTTNSSSKRFLVKLFCNDKELYSERLINENKVLFDDLKPGDYTFSVQLSEEADAELRLVHFSIGGKYTLLLEILIPLLLICLVGFIVLKKRRKEKRRVSKEKYKTSNLDKEKSLHIIKVVQEYFESSKVYLDPELRMGDVAIAVKIPIRDISQSINQNLNQGFTDFTNHYRIEEIKRALASPDFHVKYTLMGIAKSCGFNSKSSFYRAFKNQTGCTPAEYLAELQDKS